MPRTLIAPPLALYVHFPWCIRKCPYCDFNSYTLRESLPEERYVEALLCDLERQQEDAGGRPLISVFLGGGTPSLFSPTAIGRVLAAARAAFGFAESVEITLEANPGAIERGRFAEYRAAGVNRVSLGAQSFDPAALERLGRIHSPAETCRAANELHAAGLDNFNLDLMYALPGQMRSGALIDLEQAIALAPAHLSHYQLTLEPGTVFAATPPTLPSDEDAADMLAACAERLGAAGFEQYEVSAYARAGRHARHNHNYWTFGDYIGVGAGAHGKVTFPRLERIVRTAQIREPRRYLADAAGAMTVKPIERRDLPFEFMLNALRLVAGFEAELFETRTGLNWSTVAPTLEELQARGLVGACGRRWRPTPLGSRFLNELLLRFLPEPVADGVRGLSRALEAEPGAGA
ncbi:MAG TPA: radical SAM family heme chaperone HemW [Steroidobacteraceae bacterium]|nr:radical SAM family heme chaperone HemW [Steroidobacteraceae bacterium]